MSIIVVSGHRSSGVTKRIGELLIESMFKVESFDRELELMRVDHFAHRTLTTQERMLFGVESGWKGSLAKEASVQQRRKELFNRREVKRLKNAKPLKKTRVKGIMIAR